MTKGSAAIACGDFASAFKDSIPVMMGYIPLGMVFGFLFTQAGAPVWLTPVASLMIYGGASQYMMVPMMSAGMSVAAIAFATAVINLRHIFYGLSLLHKFPQKGIKRWYCVFALTDETFSLITLYPDNVSENRILWLCILDQFWWILGSFIGAVIGAAAQIELQGLDFVLTSLFAMLTCEQWRSRKTAWPLWAALAGYIAARLLSPGNALAVSILFCIGAGLAWAMQKKKGSGREINLDKEEATK